jgi:hypothetical protein
VVLAKAGTGGEFWLNLLRKKVEKVLPKTNAIYHLDE